MLASIYRSLSSPGSGFQLSCDPRQLRSAPAWHICLPLPRRLPVAVRVGPRAPVLAPTSFMGRIYKTVPARFGSTVRTLCCRRVDCGQSRSLPVDGLVCPSATVLASVALLRISATALITKDPPLYRTARIFGKSFPPRIRLHFMEIGGVFLIVIFGCRNYAVSTYSPDRHATGSFCAHASLAPFRDVCASILSFLCIFAPRLCGSYRPLAVIVCLL